MPYNEKLAAKIRSALAHLPGVEEKRMMKGIAFMVNGKMCVNVSGDELMCRFDPELTDELLSKRGVIPMEMKGKMLKGYVYVKEEAFKAQKDFDYWITLCLDFNDRAKASKKKTSSKAAKKKAQ
jgi:TfoX/Sxy family transcriptional regulator of competence genes